MSYIQKTIKEFEELLGDTIIDGGYDMSNKKDNWLSARHAENRLKSFLLRSHLNYLVEEVKRLESEKLIPVEIPYGSLYLSGFNTAKQEEIDLKKKEIEEVNSLIKN